MESLHEGDTAICMQYAGILGLQIVRGPDNPQRCLPTEISAVILAEELHRMPMSPVGRGNNRILAAGAPVNPVLPEQPTQPDRDNRRRQASDFTGSRVAVPVVAIRLSRLFREDRIDWGSGCE